MTEEEIEKAKEEAYKIYESSMCDGAGCCGDIYGALDKLAELMKGGENASVQGD